MKQRLFELRAEAACCLWEAMFMETLTTNVLDTPLRRTLEPLFDGFGSVHMRHAAINLADACCDMYDAVGGAEWTEAHELLSYDWDFCPAFLRACTWDDNGTPTPPSVEAFKALFEKELAQ